MCKTKSYLSNVVRTTEYRIRDKLNKLVKSSPVYNKLQHYLIEYTFIWIFLTLLRVNWTRTENEERNEKERGGLMVVCVCSRSLGKPFRQQYTFQTFQYVQTRVYVLRVFVLSPMLPVSWDLLILISSSIVFNLCIQIHLRYYKTMSTIMPSLWRYF